MAGYSQELSTDITFLHIDVYRTYWDGVHNGYKVLPQAGYVMYDTNDEITEPQIDSDTGEPILDPETGLPVEMPVTYYYTVAHLPLRYNFANFSWVAVLRSEVNENYIFGVGNNTEDM